MDHLVKFDTAEQFIECGTIEQVALDKLERLGEFLDVAQVGAFDLRVVEGVEVIESPNGMAGIEQSLAEVRPNETCPASDQEIHRRTLTVQAADVEPRPGCRSSYHSAAASSS